MPPSDQEPRYQLVDSNGNVVGSLFGDGSGNVVIADETDTQTTFDANGISTPALEAATQSTNYHYAGSFNASDADARLDAALTEASTGDRIYLESELYSTSRTINTKVKLIGPTHEAGAQFDSVLSLDTKALHLENIQNNGGIDINASRCSVTNINNFGSTITVAANEAKLIGIRTGTVTFNSGTSSGIIDSSINVAVTDNGTNSVGDVA